MKIDICKTIYDNIDWARNYKSISFDSGVAVHISRYHPECLKYISSINEIIAAPDFIGTNPNENGMSFELVKVLDKNVLVGIKLDARKDKLYIASVYKITDAKIKHGLENGRLKRLTETQK